MQFAGWAPSAEEKTAHLEQLRLIAHGIEIDTVQVATSMASIDTPSDLAEARSTSAPQRH
jgi:CMP-2-keto-3-deoxyoctulosonic acid synthetase